MSLFTCSHILALFPGLVRFFVCSTKCVNFVLQAMNMQGLGTRIATCVCTLATYTSLLRAWEQLSDKRK